MSRVLIAGGAGFLGSYLCDHYLERGYKVDAIDNLSTGSKKNIAHLENNKGFTFYDADIVDKLPKQIRDTNYAYILNMASPASPPHYQRLALETLQVGSVGSKNLLDLAIKNDAVYFFASTSEVYGDPEIHPQPETYKGSVNCYGPRSMYDESKRYGESLTYVYRYTCGAKTRIARFFNTYGPRMDANDGRVVSNFIVQALAGKDLTVYGDGSQTRSFCYVDDLVRGIVALIESDYEEPMNLGNPMEFTVNELAEKVLELTRSKSKVTHHPLPGDDPLQRRPVIRIAQKELNWSPAIDLEAGLKKTIDYFANEQQLKFVS